jgi:hypothetical protein
VVSSVEFEGRSFLFLSSSSSVLAPDYGVRSSRFNRVLAGWRGGLLLNVNKGDGLRIPTHAKMLIYRMPIPIDLVALSCSRRLPRRTPLDDSCLEIARSGGIRSFAPMFFSNRLVSEEAL